MSKQLEMRSINALLGEHFFIPDYQRGYRWTRQQVVDLLEDIWAFTKNSKPEGKKHLFYCLQPIVVKRRTFQRGGHSMDGWEVIDGQQRLTTVHILLNYLLKEYIREDSLARSYGRSLFTIKYETRLGSEQFLKDIREDASNIDYYHMAQSYNTIKEWFEDGKSVKDRTDRESFLSTILGRQDHEKSVQVIWYEADVDTSSHALFTRLNIGKIPLTNAELIKALFLSSASFKEEEDREKLKVEVALLWDEMERRLVDEDFWSFISNEKPSAYANKIELLFDMMAKKKPNEKDPLFTFLHFYNSVKEDPRVLKKAWQQLRTYDNTLYEWFNDRNLYHKVGYLIAIGHALGDLLEESFRVLKNAFEKHLDLHIKNSIKFNPENLTYEPSGGRDNKKIERVLLLFNVETIRRSQNLSERYPFKYHKAEAWSLEHIHAQNSEFLDRTKKELWSKWLDYHEELMVDSLEHVEEPKAKQQLVQLLEERAALRDNEDWLTWGKFIHLSTRIAAFFSENAEEDMDEMHGLGNLALLGQKDNSALNNSVFEVKRREIIRIDKRGGYIPICTRRVFLRYYNSSTMQKHDYMWSTADRKAYFQEILEMLRNYLPREESQEVHAG